MMRPLDDRGLPIPESGDVLDPDKDLPTPEQALILEANDYQLFLDLDTKLAISTFRKNFILLAEEFEVGVVSRWKSKTEAHWHVVIEMPQPLEFFERVAMQMYLGSDMTKEWLSMRRFWAGFGEVVRLFRPILKGGEPSAVYNSEGAKAIKALAREDNAWK